MFWIKQPSSISNKHRGGSGIFWGGLHLVVGACPNCEGGNCGYQKSVSSLITCAEVDDTIQQSNGWGLVYGGDFIHDIENITKY